MAVLIADPCGIFCILMTYGAVLYADYAVVRWIVLQTMADSLWGSVHAVLFNTIILLLFMAHARAVFSDPGIVPLPHNRIDFSDDHGGGGGGGSSTSPGEDWTICTKCEMYRPPRAHHCRICKHCIRRMDHHCPWINNCVGEKNQKFFIQFLLYVGLLSGYAISLVAWSWYMDCSDCPKIIFGHPMRDNLPRPPLDAWRKVNDLRELSTAKIRGEAKGHYDVGKSNLEPLQDEKPHKVGTTKYVDPIENNSGSVNVPKNFHDVFRTPSSGFLSPEKAQAQMPTPNPRPIQGPITPSPTIITPPPRSPPPIQDLESTPQRPADKNLRRRVSFGKETPDQNSSLSPPTPSPARSLSPIQEDQTLETPLQKSPESRPIGKRTRRAPAKYMDFIPIEDIDI